MKKILFILLGIFTILYAQEKKLKESPIVKCVVSGDEIDLEENSSYKNGKVYFCCGGCKEEFDESSKKFTTNANFQLLSTAQYSQTSCPITGRKIKANKMVTVDGANVAFCCNNCLGKATKSEDKLSLLFSDASFDKGFSVISDGMSKKKK